MTNSEPLQETIIDTACNYAWTYPIIDMGRGELRNCCRTPFNTINPEDWNLGTDLFSKLIHIKELKRDLLTGVKNSKCRTCWTTEKHGVTSARTGFDEFSKFINAVKWTNISLEETQYKLKNLTESEIQELVDLEHPTHIELSLSTTCDLKCVYCSHVFSTQWASERLKYNEITVEQLPKNSSEEYEKIWWDWFENKASKTVDKITFVGGEPLINDKFYYYVERLVEYYDKMNVQNRYINIFVATNFNTPKKYLEKLLFLLKVVNESKYVSMSIGLSFESTGKKNEFIRSNADWNLFDNNVNSLLSNIKTLDPNKYKFNVVIMPTINSLSVCDMPNFIRYIINMRSKFDRPIRLSNTHATYPLVYSPFILNADFIKYMDESIDLLKSDIHFQEIKEAAHGSWTSFVEYLGTFKDAFKKNTNESNKGIRSDFLRDISKLSERRKLNYKDTFPEMSDFFKLCEQ